MFFQKPTGKNEPSSSFILLRKNMSELLARNLKKSFKSRTVVNDVSIHIDSGECVGLLGPNGAGKTTCFYMIVGLQSCDEGKIVLDNNDLTRAPMHQRAR